MIQCPICDADMPHSRAWREKDTDKIFHPDEKFPNSNKGVLHYWSCTECPGMLYELQSEEQEKIAIILLDGKQQGSLTVQDFKTIEYEYDKLLKQVDDPQGSFGLSELREVMRLQKILLQLEDSYDSGYLIENAEHDIKKRSAHA